MDKTEASRSLLVMLSNMGFCPGYTEVRRFKVSAVVHAQNTLEHSEGFMQWMGDNIDHNTATLTGKGTLHSSLHGCDCSY